jgi:hypothetical protein
MANFATEPKYKVKTNCRQTHALQTYPLCLAKTLRNCRINDSEEHSVRRAFRYDSPMFVRLRHLLGWVFSVFRSREELLLENLALRQQLLALHAKRPRPLLSSVDRLVWVVLRQEAIISQDPRQFQSDFATEEACERYLATCPLPALGRVVRVLPVSSPARSTIHLEPSSTSRGPGR